MQFTDGKIATGSTEAANYPSIGVVRSNSSYKVGRNAAARTTNQIAPICFLD